MVLTLDACHKTMGQLIAMATSLSSPVRSSQPCTCSTCSTWLRACRQELMSGRLSHPTPVLCMCCACVVYVLCICCICVVHVLCMCCVCVVYVLCVCYVCVVCILIWSVSVCCSVCCYIVHDVMLCECCYIIHDVMLCECCYIVHDVMLCTRLLHCMLLCADRLGSMTAGDRQDRVTLSHVSSHN